MTMMPSKNCHPPSCYFDRATRRPLHSLHLCSDLTHEGPTNGNTIIHGRGRTTSASKNKADLRAPIATLPLAMTTARCRQSMHQHYSPLPPLITNYPRPIADTANNATFESIQTIAMAALPPPQTPPATTIQIHAFNIPIKK